MINETFVNETFFNILRTSLQGSILALPVCGVLLIFGKRISAQVRFLLIAVVLPRFLLPVAPSSSVSLFGLAHFLTVAEQQEIIEQPIAQSLIAAHNPDNSGWRSETTETTAPTGKINEPVNMVNITATETTNPLVGVDGII
ncbi:MAG: hypothetical protein LBN39_00965 [Planctomycetaceae bacterium]|jgi:hypothetical protein|nr:hypothetical protein [Planctomycetaceae bacterium]